MRLVKLKEQAAQLGMPASRREWWNIGNGYEVYIDIGEKRCILTIDSPESKDITLEVAKYLGIETSPENIKFSPRRNECELYLSSGIDCILLNYTNPINYKNLLINIETIINEHFKNK